MIERIEIKRIGTARIYDRLTGHFQCRHVVWMLGTSKEENYYIMKFRGNTREFVRIDPEKYFFELVS